MTFSPLPERLTDGEKYRPAMEITDHTEAAEYFEALVEHAMRTGKRDRAESERIERTNLGYYAGYYDPDVRARVAELYGAVHPIFGATTPPSPEKGKKK